LFTNFTADAEGITTEKIIDRLLQTVPEPMPEDYRAGKPKAAAAAPSAPAPAAPAETPQQA
ncbi:MAG: ATP-binding protein, partial [Planctomycetota bacterium]|nr:ATP-binding protein [Planctomycetota bacterium]